MIHDSLARPIANNANKAFEKTYDCIQRVQKYGATELKVRLGGH